MRVINNVMDIPIRPADIDTTKNFMNSFNHIETEISAKWVVRLCQELGGWVPFSVDQIQEFYTRPGHRPVNEQFCFNRLIHSERAFSIMTGWYDTGGGWIVVGSDGLHRVTDDFVLRCYGSAPKDRQTSAESSTPKYTTENVAAWFRSNPSGPVELNASREAMINATLADIRANVKRLVETECAQRGTEQTSPGF